jgi:hypothetical protein
MGNGMNRSKYLPAVISDQNEPRRLSTWTETHLSQPTSNIIPTDSNDISPLQTLLPLILLLPKLLLFPRDAIQFDPLVLPLGTSTQKQFPEPITQMSKRFTSFVEVLGPLTLFVLTSDSLRGRKGDVGWVTGEGGWSGRTRWVWGRSGGRRFRGVSSDETFPSFSNDVGLTSSIKSES